MESFFFVNRMNKSVFQKMDAGLTNKTFFSTLIRLILRMNADSFQKDFLNF